MFSGLGKGFMQGRSLSPDKGDGKKRKSKPTEKTLEDTAREQIEKVRAAAVRKGPDDIKQFPGNGEPNAYEKCMFFKNMCEGKLKPRQYEAAMCTKKVDLDTEAWWQKYCSLNFCTCAALAHVSRARARFLFYNSYCCCCCAFQRT